VSGASSVATAYVWADAEYEREIARLKKRLEVVERERDEARAALLIETRARGAMIQADLAERRAEREDAGALRAEIRETITEGGGT
jgi:BMFP domain-containing protein YqiC